MANLPRSTSFPASSSLRQTNSFSAGSQQSSVLASRISLKRAELDNLKQLRDLSSALAAQMQALEEKIGMLKDGTEGLLILPGIPLSVGVRGHPY